MPPPPLLSSLSSSLSPLPFIFPLPLSLLPSSLILPSLTQSGRMFETFGEEEEKDGVCLEQTLISGLYPRPFQARGLYNNLIICLFQGHESNSRLSVHVS